MASAPGEGADKGVGQRRVGQRAWCFGPNEWAAGLQLGRVNPSSPLTPGMPQHAFTSQPQAPLRLPLSLTVLAGAAVGLAPLQVNCE
jgi:hypothetical protein